MARKILEKKATKMRNHSFISSILCTYYMNVWSLGTNFLQIELYFWWTHDLYWSLINCYLGLLALEAGCRLKFISLYFFWSLFNIESDESIENITIEDENRKNNNIILSLLFFKLCTVHSTGSWKFQKWASSDFRWWIDNKSILWMSSFFWIWS